MRSSLGSETNILSLSNDGLTALLPSRARRVLLREMQRLIGYFQPSGSLNYVAECQSPADSVLREGYDVLVPGAHLHRLSPDTQVMAAKSLLSSGTFAAAVFVPAFELHLLCLSRDPGNGPGNPTQA